jgi:1-aminocyclopropane-1-carboxylate deaminase/D-cysteine desulfhydrase-like pyridoxal-dependent ACC family enzyme
MNSFPALANITANIDHLNSKLFTKQNLSVSILRLDQVHPYVSGNKIFKLIYFLDEAKKSTHKQVITFGGAYSNHLAATAFACAEENIKSIGFVRGEKPGKLSHTLLFCLENGMQLEFLSRASYKKINDPEFLNNLRNVYGQHILIPEGGFSQKGAKGAESITALFNMKNYSHLCCPIGTATTFAGLINGCDNTSKFIGFTVLKNLSDIHQRLKKLNVDKIKKYEIIGDYHFGGYAKKTEILISFIKNFYTNNKIPLDFVYTGKMMFGVYNLIERNYFAAGSKILCIHTGGLQGNESLPGGTLNF